MRKSQSDYIVQYLITGIIVFIFQAWLSVAINQSYSRGEPIIVLFILVTFTGIAMQIMFTRDRLRDMDGNLNLAWLVIFPFAWLYFAFAKGTEGENQYGKSPAQLKNEEKLKEEELRTITHPTEIDLLLKETETTIFPTTNRVEQISFQLNEANERLFYKITPENVKKLRKRLEILANRLEDNETSYGFQYAERRFCIGNNVIFSWQKEIKL